MSEVELELQEDLAKKRKSLLSGIRRNISASEMILRFKADAYMRINEMAEADLRELLSLGSDIEHSSVVRRSAKGE